MDVCDDSREFNAPTYPGPVPVPPLEVHIAPSDLQRIYVLHDPRRIPVSE